MRFSYCPFVRTNWTLLPILVFLILPIACKSAFLSKKELLNINDLYRGQVFLVKQDIHPAFLGSDSNETTPVFKKGDKISLWIESSTDWIRVKAYSLKENREQTAGKTIIYLFESDLKDDSKINEILQKRIDDLLEKTGP